MLLDEDQRDALTEVCNIGMGRAGDALSQLLDTFVALSTPRVRIVRAGESDLGLRAPGAAQDAERVTAVRQSFFVDLQGETITVFGISGANDITVLLGAGAGETMCEDETILDATSIMVGALMRGLSEELGISLALTAPSILVKNRPSDELRVPFDDWRHALVLEVRLDIEQGPFACHIFTAMPDHTIQNLRGHLDRLLETI